MSTPLPTSTWGTESDANRIKKTYVKGYMDVSGGELSVHNTAFNVFDDNGNGAFRMNPQKITVKDGVGQDVDISLSYLTFLNNLVPPDGVPISIPDKVKYIFTSGTETRVGKPDASSNFRVYGNTYVEQYLFVELDASFGQNVFLAGDASLNENLYVKSKTRLGNDLSLNGNFTMYGDASLNGRLMLSGDASFNSNLYVKSKTRLGNDLSLNGNFTMYGDASLNGRLMLSGDASLNSNLYVKSKTRLDNDLSLNGNFTMYGDASLNGRLMLSGDASFNSNLYVKSKTRLENDLSLNGNFMMYGDASLNGRLMLSGDASFNSNLYVKSKTSLGNDLSLNGNYFMYGDASLNGRFYVSNDVSLNSNLYVKSKTRLDNDLSLNGNYFMYGDASLNGRLMLSGDASFNSNLYVKSKTRLENDLSLNGNYFMYGDASLNGRLMLSGDASFNSNLYVKSKTSLGNDLSLNGNLFVYGGDVSLNGRLFVSSDASLNGNIFVTSGRKVGIGKIPGAAYSLDVSGNVNISNGVLYINDSVFTSGSASLNGNVKVGSDNGFVTVDKSPFLYDPSMTIFYDFDTSLNGTLLQNQATGQYDASLNNGASIDTVNQRLGFGAGCLDTNLPTGANEYVTITNTNQFGRVFSVSIWIKKASAPTTNPERIFDFASATNTINNNTIALSIMPSTGFIKPILTNGSALLLPGGSTTMSVSNNVWNHIVWNVTSTSSTIYINGMPSLTETVSSSVPNIIRTECYIANSNNSSAPEIDYSGLIDNFRFYSGRTLSYAEVYQLYTNQSYKLDVNGGILANGSSTIFEPVGTIPSATNMKGTLTLLHGDASGSSSIVFPSVNNFGSDYAYIEYDENIPYTGQTATESGLLTIGIENDITNTDRICLMASNGNGRVGINTKFPAYTLDVNGGVNATSYNATSDYRVKTDVMALDASFNVDVLKPVTYTNTRHGRQDIGFIAHEVQEHYPFLVNGEKDAEQFQSLNYIGLIGILTKEIQDLKRRLAETEANATSIEKKMDANMEQVYSMLTSADTHNQTVNKKIDANMEQVYSMLTSAENYNQTVNKKIDANMEQVYSMLTSAETKVASIEETINDTIASIENDAHSLDIRFSSVEAKILYVDTRVATVENKVHSIENMVHSVDTRVATVENMVHSVENMVHSVENMVLLEQAKLAICETDVALSKSAIKDLEERFQS